MDWTAENEEKVVRFIRNRCEEQDLPHFDMGAVAEVVEYSARYAEDQDKLTTSFAKVTDLIQEAAFWAASAATSWSPGPTCAGPSRSSAIAPASTRSGCRR